MAITKKSPKKVARNADRANAERGTRGPSIARTTADGKPTAYAVAKDIWSARGPMKAKGIEKFGIPDGLVKKTVVVDNYLAKGENWGEKPAPFVLKRGTLVPAS